MYIYVCVMQPGREFDSRGARLSTPHLLRRRLQSRAKVLIEATPSAKHENRGDKKKKKIEKMIKIEE